MKIVTTPTIEDRKISKYLGIVGAEVIFGANIFKDASAAIRDVIGGRSREYESVFTAARDDAVKTLEKRGRSIGADAIIGVRFDYHSIGTMMMVAATGTAVRLALSDAAREREDEFEQDQIADFYLDLDGTRRGPFSKEQLRELVNTGKIRPEISVYSEKWPIPKSLTEILSP